MNFKPYHEDKETSGSFSFVGRIGLLRYRGGIVLIAMATILSCWMLWQTWQGGGLSGCSGAGSCSEVLSSRFAKIFGIPVSLFGVALYLSLLVAALVDHKRHVLNLSRLVCWIILFAAAWFVLLQLFVLRAFCFRCSVIHLLASLGAVMLLSRECRISPGSHFKLSAVHFKIAIATVIVFAILQWFGPESKRFDIVQVVSKQDARETSGRSGENLKIVSGNIRPFGDSSLAFSPSYFPVLHRGSDVRTNLPSGVPVIFLHDWTCGHCHRLHELLMATPDDPPHGAGEQSLAVFLVPVSKDVTGREVHRIMLTAWLGARPVYVVAENALLDGSLAPDPEAVRAFVSRMNGASWQDLWKNLAPSVDAILAMGDRLLSASESRLEYSTLPQLVAPGATLVGTPDGEKLSSFLDEVRMNAAEFGVLVEMGSEIVPPVTIPQASVHVSPEIPVTNLSEIRFQNESLVLDPVKEGDSAVARFGFSNTGTEPLTISGVRASCGCTVVRNWHQTVSPGAQGIIEATFNSVGRPPGPHTKTLTILSNASNKPSALVSFSVEVESAPPGGQSSNRIAAALAPDGSDAPVKPTLPK